MRKGLYSSMNYALDIRVKNAAIAEAMALHNCTQAKLAEMAEISYSILNSYATLRKNPWSRNGPWLVPVAKKLAEFLGLSDEDAFPPELYRHFGVNPRRLLKIQKLPELPLSEARYLPAKSNQEDECSDQERRDAINRLLTTLTPREQMVIRLRFGFDSSEEKTLAEIGADFGVGSERIRQIEAKALRKLRHPSRSQRLLAVLS